MVSRELENWMLNQNPSQVKHLNGGDEATVYHLSDCDSIKRFSPRLPLSYKDKEDTTIPRICGGLDLTSCFNGIPHQLQGLLPARTLTLYSFPKYEIIVPGKSLTGVNLTLGEVWLVPYRLSIWEVVPERVGTFRLETITSKSHPNGDVEHTELVYIGSIYGQVNEGGKVLNGFYRVTCHLEDKKFIIEKASDGVEAFDKAETFHCVNYYN